MKRFYLQVYRKTRVLADFCRSDPGGLELSRLPHDLERGRQPGTAHLRAALRSSLRLDFLRLLRAALASLLLFQLFGCVHKNVTLKTHRFTKAAQKNSSIELEEFHVGATADSQLNVTVWNAETIYQQGENAVREGEDVRATVLFLRLVREFPDSNYVAPSLLQLGWCELRLKHPDAASRHFSTYHERFPERKNQELALLGLCDAAALAQEWSASEKFARDLLSILSVPPTLKQTVLAKLARALVEQGAYDDAEALFASVLRTPTTLTRSEDDRNDLSVLPMARFYLGEIARHRGEAIRLDSAIDLNRAASDLEQKATYLLAAQQHYYRTFGYGDAEWTGAAAYQMAYLYERFYRDIIDAPYPPGLSDVDHELYKEMLRDELRNVAKRANSLYSDVVRYAERLKLSPEWVQQCQVGLKRMEELSEISQNLEAPPLTGTEVKPAASPPNSFPLPESNPPSAPSPPLQQPPEPI